MRWVVGTDVSAGMLEAARRRCRGLGNVIHIPTTGQDLAGFADAAFELVAAVDVFPYLVSCPGDLAPRHIREAFRVLAPGGSLLILNYAYGDDAASEATEVTALANRAGFRLVRQGSNDFALWDGRTFHFLRPKA
jgi:ubiquinone/menaquinone biosynthesis C-methylase UbiE